MAKKASSATKSTEITAPVDSGAEAALKALLSGSSSGTTAIVTSTPGSAPKLTLTDPALLNAKLTKSGVLELQPQKEVGPKVDRFSELDAKIADLTIEKDEVGDFLRNYGAERRQNWNVMQKDDVTTVLLQSGTGQGIQCSVKNAFSVNPNLAKQCEIELPADMFKRIFEKIETLTMKPGVESLLLQFLREKLGAKAVETFFEKTMKYSVASGFDRNTIGLTDEQRQLIGNTVTRHKPTLKVAK